MRASILSPVGVSQMSLECVLAKREREFILQRESLRRSHRVMMDPPLPRLNWDPGPFLVPEPRG